MSTYPIRPDEIRPYLSQHRRTFTLAPRMWQNCNLHVRLQWHSVRYGEQYYKDVPIDSFGIYAFILIPELTGPPETAYLLYIGKTKRPFRIRFSEYLPGQPEPGDWALRPIYRALATWHDYIWFYFAPMEDPQLLKSTEQTLINACIPPCNYQFTGKIGRAISAFIRSPEG